MELEVIKKLIKKYSSVHSTFVMKAQEGRRYYRGDTDILYKNAKEDEVDNPLRTADNRIPTNWQSLLVDQKAAYLLTYPPLFDVGNDKANELIRLTLGDEFSKTCKDLCIEAANTSVGWLHVWKDENNKFQYAVVPSEQIIPIFSSDLKKRLIAVLRVYNSIDEKDGETYTVYEYWNDNECLAYRKNEYTTVDYGLEEYPMFTSYIVDEGVDVSSNSYKHSFDEVPFIPFFNNSINTNK